MNEIKTTTKKINSLFYRLYSITEKMTTNFYSNKNSQNLKKKKQAHAYFEHRIFLSFLAGKFAIFEQMLLTEPIHFFGKTKSMRLLSVRIWR